MKKGSLRMFETIGSKVLWIVVDHDHGADVLSPWAMQTMDFDENV